MGTDIFDVWLRAWNNNEGDALAAIMTDDGVYEDVPWGRVLGPATVAEQVELGHRNSSDLSVSYLTTLRSGTTYATEWEMVGTNDGPIARGLPASGRTWKIHGASVGCTERDRIKVHRDFWDLAGWLAQLGIGLPPQVDWVRANWSDEKG